MKAATTAGANTGVLAAARGQPQRREGAMLAWLLLVDDSDVELLSRRCEMSPFRLSDNAARHHHPAEVVRFCSVYAFALLDVLEAATPHMRR
jgi:hypothetical protein